MDLKITRCLLSTNINKSSLLGIRELPKALAVKVVGGASGERLSSDFSQVTHLESYKVWLNLKD